MASSERIKDDLAYVRGAVERTGSVHVPAVYLMWAAICLVGFSMSDFITNGWVGWSYSVIGWYWTVMGPLGFGASWWLSARANERAGQMSRQVGNRWGLHWAAFGATGVLGIALALSGHVGWEVYGALWVLLLALSYTLAGVHLERRLLPIGLMLGVGYITILFLPDYGWIAAGALTAVALIAQAILGARASGTAS
ncbi:MAG: hypothetical protein OXD31_12990 [Chloroflexi bacterium]|nr:hypothetical protein [Chloroflexota bacterium]